MSLITDLEHAVEEAAGVVEAKAGDFYEAAFADVRRLLAEAKAAEAKVATLVEGYKAEIAAWAGKYGPEAAAALDAALAKMLAEFKALFHLG